MERAAAIEVVEAYVARLPGSRTFVIIGAEEQDTCWLVLTYAFSSDPKKGYAARAFKVDKTTGKVSDDTGGGTARK